MGYYMTLPDYGIRYDDVKSLSFAPEIDTTCATLPICEFSIDIITEHKPKNGWLGCFVNLYEDQGRENATNTCLAAMYEIVEADQQSDTVAHIRAQSLVGYLERRILPPLYIPSYPIMYAEEFISKLFTDTPVNDVGMVFDPESLPFDVTSGAHSYAYASNVFCPEQTARERLQWFCQVFGLKVVQFGINSACGLYIDRIYLEQNTLYSTYIEIDRTYWKPKVKRVSNYERMDVTYYSDFTYSERQGNDWEKYVIQEGWNDPESGQSQEEIAMYYRRNVVSHEMSPNANYNTIYLTGNTIMRQSQAESGYVKYENCRYYEVELDILQIKKDGTEDYFWPGDKVMFHTEPDTICCGLIKSCELTFGNLVRAKLRVSTDLKPVAVVYVDFEYDVKLPYEDRPGTYYRRYKTFAKRRYTLPHNYYRQGSAAYRNPYVVKLHPFYVDGANGIVLFEPENDTVNIFTDVTAGTVISKGAGYTQST